MNPLTESVYNWPGSGQHPLHLIEQPTLSDGLGTTYVSDGLGTTYVSDGLGTTYT